MTALSMTLALGIESSVVTKNSVNYRLNSWPPEPDFPIVVDAESNVISRYKDEIWYLWPWSKSNLSFNFRKTSLAGISEIDETNANLLKAIAAWWLYGHGSLGSPTTFTRYLSALKPLFAACSAEGISADELRKFPRVINSIITATPASSAPRVCYLLHSLSNWKSEIGFEILPPSEITRLAGAFDPITKSQTPYIPPRIWSYQVERLHECLTDFRAHKEQLTSCFEACVSAYTAHYGSFEKAFIHSKKRTRSAPPFTFAKRYQDNPEARLAQSFKMLADRFGITKLLSKWVISQGSDKEIFIGSLSRYFTLINYVGLAYIMNFSMMRIGEAWRLRSDCLQIEKDSILGEIFILQGHTQKTIEDCDARWITSRSVQVAVEAMRVVGQLRMTCAIADPAIDIPDEFIKNPWLAVRNYEPWSAANNVIGSESIRLGYPAYTELTDNFDRLFDISAITITEEDIRIARDITIGLDEQRYRVGSPWKFAWHQLRRTGAVNMQGSAYVSTPSMQYQLKHATRVMSLYYGRGYSSSRMNQSVRQEYVKTMYEMLARELAQVGTQRFASPYGDSRKEAIIGKIRALSLKEISDGLQKGMFSWRPTVLGGCTKRGPCPYGGVDNIAHCGGGEGLGACADAVFDTTKGESLLNLLVDINSRLEASPNESPLHQSLKSQQKALENVLNVIQTRTL